MEATVLRRNDPGCSSSSWLNWSEEQCSANSLPIVQHRTYHDPLNVTKILETPSDVPPMPWIIEQFGRLLMDLSFFSCKLSSICTPSSCDQMKTTPEWVFLCAAHKQPCDCSGVDYTVHTIDSAIRCYCELSKTEESIGRLDLIRTHCRRLVRILLHAAHHHKELLIEHESVTALCKKFCSFCLKFDIITVKQLNFPSIPELELNL
ncbi:hypothetical protein RCL1_007648 [Eukaryota sp. TZLM3-RCL]